MTKIGRDFKRSELKVYHDRYPLNCTKALSTDYTDMAELEIAIPNGMKSSYLDTSKNIKLFYDNVGINVLKSYLKNMEDLYTHISRKNNTDTNIYADIDDANRKFKKMVEDYFVIHTKDFDSKTKSTMVPFKDKFSSTGDFKATDSTLLGLNNNIVGFGQVVSICDKTTNVTTSIVDYIINSDDAVKFVTKSFVKTLAEFVRKLAEAYDMYASVVESQVTVEHNFTKVLDKVYKEV